MSENYGKREQYGRSFSDNVLLGDDGNNFFEKPLNEQVDSIAWSEGCPVKNRVVKNNGPETARDRYGEIIFARKLILEEAKAHNPKLYEALTSNLTRDSEEPLGVHEPDSIPNSHVSIIDSNNTPWGFSLPRILLDQFGKREVRTPERIQKGLIMLEEIVQKVQNPLEFMAVLAEQAVEADADVDTVLKSLLSKGYLSEENTYRLYQKLIVELKRHSPNLWERYSELTPQERDKMGMAMRTGVD